MSTQNYKAAFAEIARIYKSIDPMGPSVECSIEITREITDETDPRTETLDISLWREVLKRQVAYIVEATIYPEGGVEFSYRRDSARWADTGEPCTCFEEHFARTHARAELEEALA